MDYQISFKILLLCSITFVNGAPPQKIVKGTNVLLGELPYIVSIRQWEQHICGGTIISSRHILTAAHCLVDGTVSLNASDITVRTGTISSNKLDGERHTVEKAVIHPGYILNWTITPPNDIAVLTLSSPILFNEYQNKINLASKDFVDKSKAIVAGWGLVKNSNKGISPILKKVYLRIEHCQKIYQVEICGNHEPGQDTCKGDSGGPLVLENEVIGVLSSGGKVCGSRTKDIYTFVYNYIDFIKSQTSQFEDL